jgi:hypothetical protein
LSDNRPGVAVDWALRESVDDAPDGRERIRGDIGDIGAVADEPAMEEFDVNGSDMMAIV